MQEHKLELSQLSAIGHRLARVEHAGQRLLMASFVGEYRPGSQGNPDAQLMKAVLASALSAWDFDGVVLDLRELSYVWGNSLLGVFDQRYPMAWSILVGEKSAAAVRSLVGNTPLHGTLEEAVAHAAEAAEELARRSDELETATLVIAVAEGADAAQRAAEVAVRAGLAAEDNTDMRHWSSGVLNLRVEFGGDLERDRVAAVDGAIAWLERD
jgi:hypothetical protein